MNIGKALRHLRLAKYPDLLQSAFAEQCKINPSLYSQIETGTREINVPKLKKVAKEFGIKVSDIIKKAESL